MIPYYSYRDNTALIDGDRQRKVSYDELSQLVDQVKAILGPSKNLVFCLVRNSVEAVAAYLGGLDGNHAVCLLDAQMNQELLVQLINAYRPHWIVEVGEPGMGQYQGYDAVSAAFEGLRFWRYTHQDSPSLHPDLALLLTTSGTTGSPKLIRLTRQNIQSNTKAICYYLGINPSQIAMASLPLHYSFGLSVLNTHLFAGASVVLTEKSIMQKEFWDQFSENRCSSIAGVPYTYQLLHRLNMRSLSIPSLQTMTQAGANWRKPLVAAFWSYMAERSGKFVVMYGQSEATARIAYVPPEILPEKLGAIGRSIPGGKLRVCDGSEVIMQPYITGELVYQGPNVMMGYAESRDDLALGDLQEGMLRTGDLGYFDSDGLFFLSGRLKRISKIYGLRINLDEVEADMCCLAPVAVTGDDHVIAIFCESHNRPKIEERLSQLSGIYQLQPAAFKCYEVAEFPRTQSDKIDYQRLQEMMNGPH